MAAPITAMLDIPDALLQLSEEKESERTDVRLKLGIELHIAVDSSWKAFSRTKVDSNSFTSLGLLGTLPQINVGAIKSALKVAKMLNCEVPIQLSFERKSYFYFDLPRGYQLTQYLNPMGKNGYIYLPKFSKKINIYSVALEEDTAAYTEEKGVYTLSPDRLGAPLIEISTQPDFETIDELIECVKWIRLLLFYLRVTKAEFEKGKLRVDLNISLVDREDAALTGRVEVKNLASYSAISSAAKAVKKFLLRKLESQAEDVMQNITCSWLSEEESLVVTREKKSGADYFFVPESSIPIIKLDRGELRELTKECDQNYLTKLYETIHSSTLADREREEITSSYNFFWDCLSFYKVVDHWADAFFILKMVRSEGWREGPHPEVLKFLSELVKKHKEQKIKAQISFNKWKLKECIGKIIKSGLKVQEASELYFSLPTIKAEDIEKFCRQVFLSKTETLLKLVDREDKLSSYLLGQVRSNFREQVEMSEAQEVVSKNLSNWREEFLIPKTKQEEEVKKVGENVTKKTEVPKQERKLKDKQKGTKNS
ncbi:glutamyl-tRNA amidotransferase [Candidatus Mycoplasma haematominutum]|uniref:glutamyl-tRNA amidotransferase n=1 Tax=Candidatus Mycoplasma haematominutum TaxID=209446 RepID=UPI0002D9985E|nr:glutamyl-tRNA amidotransferase [Candidatus Mycoplasma haematominutum]